MIVPIEESEEGVKKTLRLSALTSFLIYRDNETFLTKKAALTADISYNFGGNFGIPPYPTAQRPYLRTLMDIDEFGQKTPKRFSDGYR